MAARLSTRISRRWLPSTSSGANDTLITSLGNYYMGLHITKTAAHRLGIDWSKAILPQESRE